MSLCTVFYSISSNIDEVLSIYPSANVFVLGEFKVHHKNWLIYSGGTNYLVNSVIIFLSQTTLLRWLTFLLASLTLTLTVLLFWIYLFLLISISSDTSVCSTVAFPPLGNSDHVVVSVSIDFPSNSKRDAQFHHIGFDYSHTDWDGLCDHLRDVPWEDIFNLSASAAAACEFCEWVQVVLKVYISHRKYQVKPHSSPWFSAACADPIVYRNHFFCLYKQNKTSESKGKFRQASNRCKRVLEASKLAYANKTKDSITSQKLGSQDFWRIANSVLSKGKSPIPPLFNSPDVLFSTSYKATCFSKNFSKNSKLGDSGIF